MKNLVNPCVPRIQIIAKFLRILFKVIIDKTIYIYIYLNNTSKSYPIIDIVKSIQNEVSDIAMCSKDANNSNFIEKAVESKYFYNEQVIFIKYI